jgi:hypothetical protein
MERIENETTGGLRDQGTENAGGHVSLEGETVRERDRGKGQTGGGREGAERRTRQLVPSKDSGRHGRRKGGKVGRSDRTDGKGRTRECVRYHVRGAGDMTEGEGEFGEEGQLTLLTG